MLAPNQKFLESKTPHRESDEAFAKPSEGEVSTPTPLAHVHPKQAVKASQEYPMWQAVLITPQG